jgi:hypothetical protein
MKKVNISQVDALFSNGSYPIEVLFYYKEGFKTGALRRALRQLVPAFWPVFGRYRDGRIFFDSYREEDCYEEAGPNQELDIAEIRGGGFEVCSRYCLPELKNLFFLRVLRLKNGLALIPKMNHLAGDGYGYFYFLSVLAALSHPGKIPFRSSMLKLFLRPHHRRTMLRDFDFSGGELKPLAQADKFTVEFDEILRDDVRSVIEEAASSDNLRISSNDVLSALAMKKMAGRQNDAWGEDVNLTIPIDVRRRVKEYGRRFFGNGIMLHTIKLKRAHLEISPAKDIAVTIRKSMPSISREAYLNYLIELENIIAQGEMDKFKPFDPRCGGLVTNLSKLPLDRLDFGSGGPEFIVPLTIEKNSTGILAKNQDYILRFAY